LFGLNGQKGPVPGATGALRRMSMPGPNPPMLLPVHTMLSVHSTGPCASTQALERRRTKPESVRKQRCLQNISVPGKGPGAPGAPMECDASSASERAGARQRTKPESNRKQDIYKNISEREGIPGEVGNGSSQLLRRVIELAKGVGLVRTAGTPISAHAGFESTRTEPECCRKSRGYQNISTASPAGWPPCVVAAGPRHHRLERVC